MLSTNPTKSGVIERQIGLQPRVPGAKKIAKLPSLARTFTRPAFHSKV